MEQEIPKSSTFVYCRYCAGRVWNNTKCDRCGKKDAQPDLLAACEKIQKLAVHASNDDKIVLSGQLSGIWAMADDAIREATK